MEKVFEWRKSSISYVEFGTGPELLIAFHGFRQESSIFLQFQETLSEKYRVIAVDLPHRGDTIWREENELSVNDLRDLMAVFLNSLGHEGSIHLMAYSLGGHYALGLTIVKPELVKRIYLIAADGVGSKKFMRFITHNFLGKLLYRSFLYFPYPIFALLWLMKISKAMKPHVAKFFRNSIRTFELRKGLFPIWESAARMNFTPEQAASALSTYKIELRMLYGRFDNVISHRDAKTFASMVPDSELVVIDQGHDLVRSANQRYIAKLAD